MSVMSVPTVLLSLVVLVTFDAGAQTCPSDLPDTTRTMRMHDYGSADQLRLDTVPLPQPGEDQVLVEVHAASVNPIDWKLREGLVRDWWPLDLPVTLGRDAAGVVVGVGRDVANLRCGDQVVVVFANRGQQGTYAEYITATRSDVAVKPPGLSFAEAAAYPLVAITAWNAIEAANVKPGSRVLVQGGAGGVGSMAVQIAKARGAHVSATASSRNTAFLQDLGADHVFDYRAVRFEDAIDDVDAVIDTVGGETTARSVAVVRKGGALVSVAGRLPEAECEAAGIECLSADAGDPADALPAVGALIDAGQLRVSVEQTYPLSEAGIAQKRNRDGRTRGKLVLKVR